MYQLYKFHSLVLTNDQEEHLQNIVQPTMTEHSLNIRSINWCSTPITQTLPLVCPFGFSSDIQLYSLVSDYEILCFKRQVLLLLRIQYRSKVSYHRLARHVSFLARLVSRETRRVSFLASALEVPMLRIHRYAKPVLLIRRLYRIVSYRID